MSLIAATLAQIAPNMASNPVSVRGTLGTLVAAIDTDAGELGAIRECFYRLLVADAALVSTKEKRNARARGLMCECTAAFNSLNQHYPKAIEHLIQRLNRQSRALGLRQLQGQVLAHALKRIQAGKNPARELGLIRGRGKPVQASSTRGFNAAVRCEYLIRTGMLEKAAAKDAAAKFGIALRKVEEARAKERALLAALRTEDLMAWDTLSPV